MQEAGRPLDGRVALVTGGGRGIGRAIVARLAAGGARVAVCWQRDEAAAQEALAAARLGPARGIALQLEMADRESVRGAVAATVAAFDGLDILVPNAGVWNAVDQPLGELPEHEPERTLSVNLGGVIRLVDAAIPQLTRQGVGRVVLIGSTAGVRGEAGHAVYAASKGALVAFARSLTAEWAPFGVTANVVRPGWVSTEMTAAVLTPERRREVEAGIPTRRVTRPDEIAAAVAFLAGPDAAQISGAALDVNGGAVFG